MSLNYVTFNQDYSHLAVDPFLKSYETHEGNVSLLEMLFSTSLVATVLSPRRLKIINTKRNATICELTFPNTILALRMNRKRLVVVLEDQIYLYDISNMNLVHTIDTSPNTLGICALSPTSESCYLTYPLPQKIEQPNVLPPSHVPPNSPHLSVTSGHVSIFDALSMQAVNVIEAHRAPLSCIAMNTDGTRLATASEKGTVIRVFSVPDGAKLFQFRRGSIPARIISMSFNATSTLLCVSSATETIHVFRINSSAGAGTRPLSSGGHARRPSLHSASSLSSSQLEFPETTAAPVSPIESRAHDGTFAGMIRRTSQSMGKSFAATVGNYLPSAVTEMLEPQRDFAWFKVPKTTGSGGQIKSVVALSSNSPQVMVVTNEGSFLVFNIDLENGGEGFLTKQTSVLDSDERPWQPTTGD